MRFVHNWRKNKHYNLLFHSECIMLAKNVTCICKVRLNITVTAFYSSSTLYTNYCFMGSSILWQDVINCLICVFSIRIYLNLILTNYYYHLSGSHWSNSLLYYLGLWNNTTVWKDLDYMYECEKYLWSQIHYVFTFLTVPLFLWHVTFVMTFWTFTVTRVQSVRDFARIYR